MQTHLLISIAISFDKFDLRYSAGGGFENSLCGGKAVLLWNFKFQHPEWVRSFWMKLNTMTSIFANQLSDWLSKVLTFKVNFLQQKIFESF